MRSIALIFLFFLFITSAFLNCTLYGSVARAPYYGITITEYAEKERDVFLLMYIAGGSILPGSEKIMDMSVSLTRRVYGNAFRDTLHHSELIGPYATSKTFDLPAAIIRLLYWVTPLSLAFLLIVLLMPRKRAEDEEEE